MLSIDTLAYASKLRAVNPRAKLLFGLVILILCIALNSLIASVLAIFLTGTLSVRLGGVPLRKFMRLLYIPLGFLVIGTLTIVIGRQSPDAVMLLGVQIGGGNVGMTEASLMFGLHVLLRALGAVCGMYFISVNTPMNDILAALRSLRCPLLLVFLMELIYRYIFVFLDEAARMHTAQDSRLGYVNVRTGIRSLGKLIAALFMRVYLRCDRIYASLESRGYEGDFKTVSREFAPSGWLYALTIPAALILSAAAIAERLLF